MTVVTDITEQKRAEEELARKEAQLRVALDNMPGSMVLVDRDVNIVLFNAHYSELHNYPEGFLKVGMSAREEARFQAERGDFGPGDTDGLADQVLSLYRGDKAASWERTFPDGRTLRFNMAPTPEGGNATIATDITEIKQAEQAAAEAQALLNDAIDFISEGFALYGADDRLVLCNKTYRDLWGYSDTDAAPGVHWDDLDRLDVERGTVIDEGSGMAGSPWRSALSRRRQRQSIEIQFTDGRWVTIRDRKTATGGSVSIQTDITELKRAEAGLIDAKRRSEEASKLIAEKNRMLESLSNQLSKYLSPQVYSSIFSGQQSVEIASKRKKLTVFFSDIADFTGTTDSLESEELTNLLNHYLSEMSKIGHDHGATIDKYVGDAIIAFFDDPETRGVKEDARACVNMAIAMQRRMQELQSEWLDMGLERPFQLRIGINTGFCTVGNFGSEDRMDYTIIGNEVNLAARLESHAEVGGILLAHETHALVKNMIMAEEGDALTVKGFAKPVRTYSVVGLYDDLAEQGRVIHMEQDVLALVIDRDKLTKKGKADAIKGIKDVLSQLED